MSILTSIPRLKPLHTSTLNSPPPPPHPTPLYHTPAPLQNPPLTLPSLTPHHSPFITHPSSLSLHRSPLTIHHTPLFPHCFSLIIHPSSHASKSPFFAYFCQKEVPILQYIAFSTTKCVFLLNVKLFSSLKKLYNL